MATIRKRTLPSGLLRWQASYVDAAGNRRAKLFDKKSAADAWLIKTGRDLQLGIHVPEAQSPTIESACDDFLEYCEGRNERGERMTTKNLKLCKGHVANHILHPEIGIGALRIGKLKKSDVVSFRDRLRGSGVSVGTTRKIIGTLCRALDVQISKDRLAINPARNVKVESTRKETKRRVTIPTKEAIRGLLAVAEPDMRVKILFAAFTGLRASEMWAARWKHLDLIKQELTVETRVDAYGDEDVTKSAAGMREIPVSDALVAELKVWKLRSAYSKADDLIFPNGAGNYVNHSNFLNRDWASLHAGDGGGQVSAKFKWHHLRHFAASCWIDAGLQPKTVQTFIGHASLAMTMDLYGHLFKSADHKQAMDNIAAGLIS